MNRYFLFLFMFTFGCLNLPMGVRLIFGACDWNLWVGNGVLMMQLGD